MSGRLVIQAIKAAREEQARADGALSQSSRLLTLLILADAANKAGVCWPSQNALARLTRLSVRTIGDALVDLERDGHISVDSRNGRNASFTVHPRNHFRGTSATIAGVGSTEPNPRNHCRGGLQPLQDTPATIADEPYKEPNKEPGARAGLVNGQRAPEAQKGAVTAADFARLREDPAGCWAEQEKAAREGTPP